MKRINFIATIVGFLAIGATFTSCSEMKNKQTQPPTANKVKKELTAHGHTRVDNYYWLNDREDPNVISYLKEENAYTKAVLKHTEEFQDKLFDEIVGGLYIDSEKSRRTISPACILNPCSD